MTDKTKRIILIAAGILLCAVLVVGIPLFAVIYDIVRRVVDHGLVCRGENALLEEYRVRYPENSPSALDFDDNDIEDPEDIEPAKDK